MSDKAHDGYLKLLSLRNRGQHGKAIAWLNKTNSFDETIRLYLTARFHLNARNMIVLDFYFPKVIKWVLEMISSKRKCFL